MQITVVGGGPGGLYLALLMKRTNPEHRVTVYERNRPDDTFGFGVVFSDETLDHFLAADPPTYEAIRDSFAYWDDIEVHVRGEVLRSAGHGFCGCSRKILLQVLQQRCGELGVELQFEHEVTDLTPFAGSDVIVAADGIASQIRDGRRAQFGPTIDTKRNKFIWLGSTRPLDAFTFFFRKNRHGLFAGHCYQYEPGHSAWVIECTQQTWQRAGLDGAGEAESARFLEDVFAEELAGHKLVTNRSIWRNFPAVRNERWSHGNIVLLGDAKSTAHFSVGSGTKLAMEDAIALARALGAEPSVRAAFAAYEDARREEVAKTQHAANVSLAWFEDMERTWHHEPLQFAFSLISRSKQITYDNLRLRDARFVDAVDRWFAGHVGARQGFDVPAGTPPMFTPLRLREMVLDNRVVVSPMCQYSAHDGLPGDWHLVHLGSRAQGGAGLVYTEMTAVSEAARISHGCAGIYSDAHEAAWGRIVDFVHANSRAKICLQLGHAGRKGATGLMWEGMDEPLADGDWPIVSASPLPYLPHSQVPAELDRAQMDAIVGDYARAAARAIRAGFDMLELHAAHGYLLACFISSLTNRRADDYGGRLENRLGFPLEVFDAMRAVWPPQKPISVRISATDWKEGGITGDDAVEIARAFATHGADLIDVSAGQTVADDDPVYGRMFQTPFSDQIRNELGIATMAVGNITSADQVNTILAAGRADLVALARPHLTDPYFTQRAAAAYGIEPPFWPSQYLPGKEQLFRLAEREREEKLELKRAAKPRSHTRRAA